MRCRAIVPAVRSRANVSSDRRVIDDSPAVDPAPSLRLACSRHAAGGARRQWRDGRGRTVGGGSGSAVRRVAAMAVDWLIISCYAAALIPLGLLLVHRSVDLPPAGWNA